jgi:hypothetical protein
MEQPLVPIRNIDELKKILFIQKSVTQTAVNEMTELLSDEGEMRSAKIVNDAERMLIDKYASYPTLSEFAVSPNLANASKWGATFGVAVLVGSLILEEIKEMQPHFEPVLRHMFVLLLKEMAQPQHAYLIEPLEKALIVKMKAEDGGEITEEERKAFVRRIVTQLTEAIVIVGIEYGIIQTKTDGFTITPLGRRVLLHMLDAQRFVDEMTEAHKRFQSVKPKLSMS